MNNGSNRAPAMVLGGVLVLIGALFLARNLIDFDLGDWNWWALFILIPAVGSLTNAWRVFQAQGQPTAAARGPAIVGLVLLLVTAILLFNLSWGTMWPLFLIIIGIGMLVIR